MGTPGEDAAPQRCDDVSAMDPRNVAPNARAAVFAAVCTLLAVAAHRLMSATGIPLAAEVFGAAAVFCLARIAASLGERGLPAIGALVGGAQIGLHLLFQTVQASWGVPARVPSAASASMPGMDDMSGMTGISSGTDMPSGPSLSLLGTTTGMTIAHILAAAFTAWWLRRGEAALFGAVERGSVVVGASWRMLTGWAAGSRPIRTSPPAAPGVALAAVRQRAVVRVLLFAVIRRGPPPAMCR